MSFESNIFLPDHYRVLMFFNYSGYKHIFAGSAKTVNELQVRAKQQGYDILKVWTYSSLLEEVKSEKTRIDEYILPKGLEEILLEDIK